MASPTEITSREYKLLLSTTRFRSRDSVADEWLELVKRVIARAGGTMLSQKEVEEEKARAKGKDPEWPENHVEAWIEKERTTWFLDTPDNGFRNRGWILRARRKKKNVDITVKFRSPDRLLSALKNASSPLGGEGKFEEDIVPAFSSQYSRSNTLEDQDADAVPRSVGDAAKLFPALGELGILPDTSVETVDGLVVNEVVRRVGGFRFDGGPLLEMSHSFWYVGETKDRFPMVAEFSFEFVTTDGDFAARTVEGASKVYRDLQSQAGWLDVAGTTKSALVAGGV
jgi:hypothetical protein